MATKKHKLKPTKPVVPQTQAPEPLKLLGPGRVAGSLDVIDLPHQPHFKQRRIDELVHALNVIRDAVKMRFPEDPTAFVEIKPFKDGFTLNARGVDDDEAPSDCSSTTLANAIYSERALIRRTSNREAQRSSNR